MTFQRYAIYHAPASAGWTDWATGWLGWDMVRGREVRPPLSGCADWDAITAAPRRYGLHATIKAPFRLIAGATQEGLERAVSQFCAAQQAVPLGAMELVALGRFLALVPRQGNPAVGDLAAAVVRDFDRFRAPLTKDEITRRGAQLSEQKRANLLRWGYPHVMEAFRFHITLTGRLGRAQREGVAALLRTHLVPLLPAALGLDALCLVGEDNQGRFHLISRHELHNTAGAAITPPVQ